MAAIPDAAANVARPSGGIPRLRPGSIPFLSYGFRPFFLGGALWACFGMILWISLLSGAVTFASAYGGVAWHIHEFLFGYVSAVMTGFLLTAIPNWTGRLPLQGGRLLGLFTLWVLGRAAMLFSDVIGLAPAVFVDSSYLFVLASAVLREILVGKNWRNLKVVALVGLIALANVAFHVEVILSGAPVYGARLGIAAIIGLIVLIGGRVTPSFTSSFLARQGDIRRPVPFSRYDLLTILVTAVALVSWVAAPRALFSATALLLTGVLQTLRLFRWAGLRTWREPIVFVLHAGYAFVPAGALLLAASIVWPDLLAESGALHAWTTGAIGVMTLAIMTRATRGHTGHSITSGPATILIYAAVLLAALFRVAAPLVPVYSMELLYLSATLWLTGFGTFIASYGSMLVRSRRPNTGTGC